ncbi:N-acetyltransferase [Salinigranum rubrum]|uniref:N-acetyltransferase n=1 Tax=Salinigranum rubrum TaxID=755307 RepID=A0A2I8VGX6_9EURY|nr:GNAT family N-acetyltransferase [Salinigranum rubrum]AUV81144.1 N-acetyltransferase [Salinigranum rubrum]
MDVRDADPSDAEAIREVHARSITELGRQAYSPEQVDAWVQGCESADYASAIESDDLTFIVAEKEGQIVGFGSLRFETSESDSDAEVTAVYVHPSVVRQGVGTAIHAELERRARAHGAQSLGLSSSLNAVPFYEARGYEHFGERFHEFSAHEETGVTGTVVEMRKRL